MNDEQQTEKDDPAERERERVRVRDAGIQASVDRYIQAGRELRAALRVGDDKAVFECDRLRREITRNAIRARTGARWDELYGAACTAEARRIAGQEA